MPHEIVSRTVGLVTENRVIIDSGHPPLARTMEIGSDWTKLRIGIRLSLARTSNWASIPRFYFGLTSGKTSLPGIDPSVDHFIGLSYLNNIDYVGASSQFYAYWSNTRRSLIVNGTETAEIGSGTDTPFALRISSVTPSAWILEFNKASTWTLESRAQAYTQTTGCTAAQFSDMMNSVAVPMPTTDPWNRDIFNTSGQKSVSGINEATNGYFDTVCFTWADPDYPFEISDFGYTKLEVV